MLPAQMNLHIIIGDQSTTQENYVDDNIISLALGTSCGLFHVRICPTGPSVSHIETTQYCETSIHNHMEMLNCPPNSFSHVTERITYRFYSL